MSWFSSNFSIYFDRMFRDFERDIKYIYLDVTMYILIESACWMKWLTDIFILIKENWPLSLIGKVNQYKWCSVMGCVLDMDLPWRTLRPKLARCDENGMVAYETTFEEMRIYHRYSGVCLMNLHDFCFITACCMFTPINHHSWFWLQEVED